jgi:hypothetical protein
MKRHILLFAAILFPGLCIYSGTAAGPMKLAPSRPSEEAEVVLEWMDILNDCQEGKICVQGLLYNSGRQTARNVKLRIEIGGTKYSPPRIVLGHHVNQSVMEPGDRQEFDITIDRKISYGEKGKPKTIEVGKFNFKIVPSWSRPAIKKFKKK